jgi:hypothetical protein
MLPPFPPIAPEEEEAEEEEDYDISLNIKLNNLN